MKFSASTVLVLSLAGLALLETASASFSLEEEPKQQRGALRGGVVDEVLQDVRNLGKKKKKTESDDDSAEDGGDEDTVDAKVDKKKEENMKNKAAAGGGGVPFPPNRVDETSTRANLNRSSQCSGTKLSLTVDKKGAFNDPQDGGGYTYDEEALCETDEECESCCCMGGYHGFWPPNNKYGKAMGSVRRVCAWSDGYTSPANYCKKAKMETEIPTDDQGDQDDNQLTRN